MKKITFLLLSLFALGANAQQRISHSVSMAIGTQSVSCSQGTGATSTSRANAYSRFFNLSSFGITQSYQIDNVQFGALGVRIPTLPQGFPVTVSIYSTTSATFAPATFPNSFSLEATEDVLLQTTDAGSLITVPISATIPVGTNILVVVSYESQVDGSANQFLIGQNGAGQTGPSYLMAEACGANIPTDISTLGSFPTAQVVMAVNAQNLSVKDNALKTLAVYPNPAKDVLNFNLPQNVELQKVNLADITGKQVELTVNNNTVDIARFAPGVYMLSIQTNEGNITRKVVKN